MKARILDEVEGSIEVAAVEGQVDIEIEAPRPARG